MQRLEKGQNPAPLLQWNNSGFSSSGTDLKTFQHPSRGHSGAAPSSQRVAGWFLEISYYLEGQWGWGGRRVWLATIHSHLCHPAGTASSGNFFKKKPPEYTKLGVSGGGGGRRRLVPFSHSLLLCLWGEEHRSSAASHCFLHDHWFRSKVCSSQQGLFSSKDQGILLKASF